MPFPPCQKNTPSRTRSSFRSPRIWLRARAGRCRLLLWALLSTLCLLPLTLKATELLPPDELPHETLRVGVLHIPPLAVVTSSMESSGPLVDYIRRLMQISGHPYRLEGYPARRLYRNLGAGESQFWIGLKNVPEYEGKVFYSEHPVHNLHLNLYRLAGTPEIHQLSELQTQRLIVIRGYSYGGLLEPLKQRPQGLQMLDASENRKALEMLQLHRGDYLLSYAEPIDIQLQKSALHPTQLPAVQRTEIQVLPMYLVLSRLTPQAELLMRQLNGIAEKMRQDGETARIFAHYPD
jgi:polar amino acid transport system substrate-binding protein